MKLIDCLWIAAWIVVVAYLAFGVTGAPAPVNQEALATKCVFIKPYQTPGVGPGCVLASNMKYVCPGYVIEIKPEYKCNEENSK